MTGKKKRVLKVYSKFQRRRYCQAVEVPEIRLCGQWLRDAGFEVGDSLLLVVNESEIVIKKS